MLTVIKKGMEYSRSYLVITFGNGHGATGATFLQGIQDLRCIIGT